MDALSAVNGKEQENMTEVSLEEKAEAQQYISEPEEVEEPGIPKSASVQSDLDEVLQCSILIPFSYFLWSNS